MKNLDKKVASLMARHYFETFRKYGPTSRGVDWGNRARKVNVRHEKMSALFGRDNLKNITLLDVGCGYGAFYEFLTKNKTRDVRFTGIDVSQPMIKEAQKRFPRAKFLAGDFMSYDFGDKKFDYIICNGIFTQKLSIPARDMRNYLKKFIGKMDKMSRRGFAFNVMSSHVNFRRRNLFYLDPAWTVTYLLKNVSGKVIIDHAAVTYEYFCYVYK